MPTSSLSSEPRRPSRGPQCLAIGLVLSLAGVARADGPVPAPDVVVPPAEVVPPPVVEIEPCQATSHPNGRVASIVCGPAQEPLRKGGYRYTRYSGTQMTYYEHGGVHEVLPLKDGVLDGIVEVYDPTGHLIERLIFRDGQKQETGVAPVTPPPLPSPETITAEMPAEDREHRRIRESIDSDDNAGVGLGLMATTIIGRNARGTFLQLGPAVDMMFRFGPKFAVELRAEFAHTVTGLPEYKRLDVPLTIGIRYGVTQNKTRLYLLTGLGADYAWRRIPGNIQAQQTESAWMFDIYGGVGLGGRVTQRLYWLWELRLGGLIRADDKPRLQAPDENGMLVEQLGNQFTAQLNVGVMWMP